MLSPNLTTQGQLWQMNEEGLAFAIAIPVVRQMNEEGLTFAIAIPVVSLGMVAQMLNPYYSSIMSNAKTLLRYYKF